MWLLFSWDLLSNTERDDKQVKCDKIRWDREKDRQAAVPRMFPQRHIVCQGCETLAGNKLRYGHCAEGQCEVRKTGVGRGSGWLG